MILLQRRGEIGDELIRQLRLEGIRVGGSDRIALRNSLVVKDMLALAAFALLPEDDHTLAVVLRSPLCGTLGGGSVRTRLEPRSGLALAAAAGKRGHGRRPLRNGT